MQKVYAIVVYYFLYRENDGIVSLSGCSYALANGGGDWEWSCFCPAAQLSSSINSICCTPVKMIDNTFYPLPN